MLQPSYWKMSMTQGIHDSLLPLQAIAEMVVLKVQSDKEQTMCEAEWKHLTQLLDADRQQRVSARCVTAARCHHCRCNPRAYCVQSDKAAGHRTHVADESLPHHSGLAAHHKSRQGRSIVESSLRMLLGMKHLQREGCIQSNNCWV